ncbi:DEAD/DEAH box helicase [Bacillus alkalisoli]|uniref:DEAD/DEAH box helicase n=1 Tax=Bacillus alkalisoli TaxID=2011008 RepID=UPI000C2482C4|nr:DEAD/DEAH box helicase [Bacillus alkalisoli]
MINNLLIQTNYIEDTNQFFLFAEDNGRVVAPEQYVSFLFTWHESSFYGTNVKIESFDGVNGIFISPYEALELFTDMKENSFFHVEWCDQSELFRLLAPTMTQFLEEKMIEPDFRSWKHGEFQFTLTEDAHAYIEKNNLLSPHLSFLEEWLTSVMFELLKEEKVEFLRPFWPSVEKFSLALLEDEKLRELYQEKEDWLWDIGWYKDTTPFTVGLRIVEPEEDEVDWKLETLLKDKKSETLYVYGVDRLPAKYKGALDSVVRTYNKWAHVTPTLFTAGDIKGSLSEDSAWHFLIEDSEKLMQVGAFILLPSWWQAVRESRLKVKARVTTPKVSGKSFVGLQSLVNFEWRFSTKNKELSEEEFLALVEQNRRLVRIGGEWVALDPSFIHQIRKMMEEAEQKGISFEDLIKNSAQSVVGADGLDDNAVSDMTIEMTGEVQKLFKKLYEGKEVQSFVTPAGFQGELRPYQQHGAGWLMFLRKYGFGACLADDMGLGKTIQLIAYFLTCKEEGVDEPVLIVAPTSVLGNWQKELEKFAPSLNVMLHYGGNRAKGDRFVESIQGADVVLTSYAISYLDVEELTRVRWSTVCLDEAQNIKNSDTKQSQAARKLRGEHHIALTGTPMENRLAELWAIFDFINPTYLDSLGAFHRQFVVPIEREQNKEKVGQLQKLIQPFLLRRTKKDEQVALNLPDKQEQKEYCPLTVEQASIYEQLVKETLDQVNKLAGIQRRGLVLKMLGQLKQVCNHPSLYLKETEWRDLVSRSNKMEKLVELVQNIDEREESCLIFTQYISMGNMIVDTLSELLGEKVEFLHGSVVKGNRDKLIERFQAGEFKVLVLSLKAGGTGLNLTAANHVIHYDRWWNPAVENQATDRAYRIGQKRFVHVHKFITTGTLEEKIDAMIDSKQSLNDQIITSENWITELSNEELAELLVLR